MTYDRDARWQELDALLDRLFDAAPQRREAILREVAAEDPDSASDARRLVLAAEGTDLVPGGALATDLLRHIDPSPHVGDSLLGKRIGPWRLVEELGRGGMGQVYLAERAEGRFEQRVALKLMPAGPHSEELLRRFEQERQILARLDHPHIARLLDGGTTDEGRPWFAMELVDGIRIDRYCDRRRLGVDERLRLFVTVAEAVDAAHGSQVLHRDLKPANILVTPAGEVKLVDFGIAKPLDTEQLTADATHTLHRLLTPSYATPEQVRGEKLTAASDVYQLGLLLYELLTGRRAHRLEETTPRGLERVVCETSSTRPSQVVLESGAVSGNENAEAIAAARGTTPEALSRTMRGDLEAIVMMALRKQPGRRYPTAGALAADVERHIGGLPVAARPETRRYRSARYLARHRLGVAATAGAALAVSVVALAGILAAGDGRSRHTAGPFQNYHVRQLTALGDYFSAALAPDGRRVIFSEIHEGRQRLRLLRLDTGRERSIPLPTGYRLFGLKFAPDGQSVFFASKPPETNHAPPALYRLALSGGVPVPVLPEMRARVDFALDPEGRRAAFVRTNAVLGVSRLIVADLRTRAERTVAERPASEPYSFPAWSPDGRSLAVSVGSEEAYAERSWPAVVDLVDGTEDAATDERWQYIAHKAWLPGGRGIVFVARKAGGLNQLWTLSRGSASAQRVTHGPFRITGALSFDSRGRSLVTLQTAFLGSLWVAPEGDASRARRLTTARSSPAVLHDGQIVFLGSGHRLRGIRADGSHETRLPAQGQVLDVRASEDGRWIVYSAARSGASHVWRAAADGSQEQQLTRGSGEKFADISPDGQWVVYVSVPDFSLWRLDVDGGPPTKLHGPYVRRPVISPDGLWIAFGHKPTEYAPWRVLVLPATEDSTRRTLPIRGSGAFDWSPDGKAIDYVDQEAGGVNLWRLSLAGGDPVLLTDFRNERIAGFAWSQNGAQLAVVRGDWKQQLLLFQDLR